jgi:hypothetical protein
VAVERVSLRLPGPPGTRAASADFGRRVATRAAALLAQRLPAGAARAEGAAPARANVKIDRIKLRVPARALGEAALSEAIAEALARAMSRNV